MERRTVLVVDDEPLFRQTVVEVLTEWFDGIEAVGLPDGVEALAYLSAHHVDVLVTDIQMPRMDGISLLKEMINHRHRPAVIVTTAHGTPQLERWATSALAFTVLEKPVDLPVLLGAIEQLLAPAETGRLQGITLPGFCQLLQLEQKTCELRIQSGDRAGRLLFRSGKLEDAVHEAASGNLAAMEMLTWPNPTVELSSRLPAAGAKRVTEDVTFLLFEAVRFLDERRRQDPEQVPASFAAPTSGPASTPQRPGFQRKSTPRGFMARELPGRFPSSRPAESSPLRAYLTEARAGSEPGEPVAGPPSGLVRQDGAALQTLRQVDGFVGAAMVNVDTGKIVQELGAEGETMELIAATQASIIRANRKVMHRLSASDDVEDLLLTLGRQYHLVRPLRPGAALFLYLVLTRQTASLGYARLALAEVARTIDR